MLLSVKSIEHCANIIHYAAEEKVLVDNPRWRKVVSHTSSHDNLVLHDNKLHKVNPKIKVEKVSTLTNDSSLVNKLIVTLNYIHLLINA